MQGTHTAPPQISIPTFWLFIKNKTEKYIYIFESGRVQLETGSGSISFKQLCAGSQERAHTLIIFSSCLHSSRRFQLWHLLMRSTAVIEARASGPFSGGKDNLPSSPQPMRLWTGGQTGSTTQPQFMISYSHKSQILRVITTAMD